MSGHPRNMKVAVDLACMINKTHKSLPTPTPPPYNDKVLTTGDKLYDQFSFDIRHAIGIVDSNSEGIIEGIDNFIINYIIMSFVNDINHIL